MSVAAQASSGNQSQVQNVCVDVHALHKSATMFLFKFFRHLAQKQHFAFYSENNEVPDAEGPQIGVPGNFCRCPLRTFETQSYQRGEDTMQHRIFQIRDPRDILVSEYFSVAWIHPTEGSELEQRRQALQQMPIDEYVLKQSERSAWPLEEKFRPLLNCELDAKRETIVTYEQMVTDFPRWVELVLPHFGVRFPKLSAIKLAWRYRNEFKTAVESMTHKRRIVPGDFRDKLQASTVAKLNERFEDVLTRFGYLS